MPTPRRRRSSSTSRTVTGVRLEITDANEHGEHKYVAVSEFDIANTPARTNTVYATAELSAGTDGPLISRPARPPARSPVALRTSMRPSPVYCAEVRGGTTVTLTAEQVDGLEFVGWFAPCSKEPVSTDASCKITADHNVALEAPTNASAGTRSSPVGSRARSRIPSRSRTQPEPEPAPQPYAAERQPAPSSPLSQQQPGDRPDDKPVDKPSSKPSGQSDDKLVATGDVLMAMVGTALVGGMGLVAAGAKRRRR